MLSLLIAFSFVACKNEPVVPEEPKVPENAVKVVDVEKLETLLTSEDEAVIALDEDIKLIAAITIKGTKTLYLNDHVLDLDGKTIAPETDSSLSDAKKIRGGLLVDNDAKLTINGNGEVKSTKGLIAINDKGEVIVNGGKFTTGFNAPTICVRGKLTVNDGELHSDDHSTLYLVSGCEATVNGGKLYSDNETIVININGSLKEGLKLNITGGEFYGTIYFAGNTTTKISGGKFVCTKDNVPIYIKSGFINITGGEFIGLEKKEHGVDYVYWGSGYFALNGDIIVDFCGYPGGAPAVNVENAKLTSGIYLYDNPEKADAYKGRVTTEYEVNECTEFTHKKALSFKIGTSPYSVTLFFKTEARADAFTEELAKQFCIDNGVNYSTLGAKEKVVPVK